MWGTWVGGGMHQNVRFYLLHMFFNKFLHMRLAIMLPNNTHFAQMLFALAASCIVLGITSSCLSDPPLAHPHLPPQACAMLTWRHALRS